MHPESCAAERRASVGRTDAPVRRDRGIRAPHELPARASNARTGTSDPSTTAALGPVLIARMTLMEHPMLQPRHTSVAAGADARRCVHRMHVTA